MPYVAIGYVKAGYVENRESVRYAVQKLEPGALVSLFVLEVPGMDTFRFHPGVNGLNSDVVWQGNTYTRFPIEASGFDRNSKGQLPRPKVQVANVSGLMGALLKQTDDMVGSRVTRKRTFAKYLDAVNFPGGVNPTADPSAEFPQEVFYVDRKSNENNIFVEFELSAAFDMTGVQLPRRQVIQNVCPWRYRGPECGYTGGAVANISDSPTGDMSQDQCGKRLVSCKMRFGEFNELPYGGFPSAGLIR